VAKVSICIGQDPEDKSYLVTLAYKEKTMVLERRPTFEAAVALAKKIMMNYRSDPWHDKIFRGGTGIPEKYPFS